VTWRLPAAGWPGRPGLAPTAGLTLRGRRRFMRAVVANV